MIYHIEKQDRRKTFLMEVETLSSETISTETFVLRDGKTVLDIH